jgi:conserved hypothetical protein
MLPTLSLALSSTALGLAIFNGAVLNARVQQLTQERDIYASRFQNWSDRALRDEETISVLQDRLDSMADGKIYLEEAGTFMCTAYCTEQYQHICGEGRGITASGQPIQADVTVAADQTLLPYGMVLYIEGVGIRIVQDKGAGVQGYHLDVAVDTHENALACVFFLPFALGGGCCVPCGWGRVALRCGPSRCPAWGSCPLCLPAGQQGGPDDPASAGREFKKMLVHVRFSCSLYLACVALLRVACRGYTLARNRAVCQALLRVIYFLHKTLLRVLCKLHCCVQSGHYV